MPSVKITERDWMHTCFRCGNKWPSKKEHPGTCANPDCRSPYWDKKREKN